MLLTNFHVMKDFRQPVILLMKLEQLMQWEQDATLPFITIV